MGVLSCFLVFIFFLNVCISRIPPNQRKFTSESINNIINEYMPKFKDPIIASLFENCLPNCLDTTVSVYNEIIPDTYIITGDINATWLRDTMNQVLPYLSFARNDTHLRRMICGIIHRQANDVLVDSYANAFNYADEGGPNQGDFRVPPMTPHIFEGKYELDSIVSFLKLSGRYYLETGDLTCFSSSNFSTVWTSAVQKVISTMKTEQIGTKETRNANIPYQFGRVTEVSSDSLYYEQRGPPSKNVGLVKGKFRPSDDASTFPFLIPANAMAVVELRNVALILNDKSGPVFNSTLANEATALAQQIDNAIQKYGLLNGLYAYEVDGFGSFNMMDDANIPSLLSLPFLGYLSKNDSTYQSTRKFLWSEQNPFFYNGSYAHGISSPHTSHFSVWPMSIIMHALTSDNEQEIAQDLEILKSTTSGTNFMHESFNVDDPTDFTRSWFAWANTLFGQLILTLAKERPNLIFK